MIGISIYLTQSVHTSESHPLINSVGCSLSGLSATHSGRYIQRLSTPSIGILAGTKLPSVQNSLNAPSFKHFCMTLCRD